MKQFGKILKFELKGYLKNKVFPPNKLPPMFIFLMSLSYVIDEIVETRIEYNVFSVYSVV